MDGEFNLPAFASLWMTGGVMKANSLKLRFAVGGGKNNLSHKTQGGIVHTVMLMAYHLGGERKPSSHLHFCSKTSSSSARQQSQVAA